MTLYILCLATQALILMTSAQSGMALIETSTSCAEQFCGDRGDGNYRHCDQEQCLKGSYISCSNGYTYVMPCPATLYFHEAINSCDYTPDCPSETPLIMRDSIQAVESDEYN